MHNYRKDYGTFAPDSGTVTVIVREHPESMAAVAYSGYQHVFRLMPGDSVAVTQRDISDGSVSTRFFEVKDGGCAEEYVAPHGIAE